VRAHGGRLFDAVVAVLEREGTWLRALPEQLLHPPDGLQSQPDASYPQFGSYVLLLMIADEALDRFSAENAERACALS
jgi:hypothetical protein